jgi:hypothetical protein
MFPGQLSKYYQELINEKVKLRAKVGNSTGSLTLSPKFFTGNDVLNKFDDRATPKWSSLIRNPVTQG